MTQQNFESGQPVWRNTKIKRPLEYLKDYHCNLNIFNISSRVKYPLNYVLSYNNLSHSYIFFVVSLSSHIESNNYSKAVKHDCWRKAIQCKIYILELNQTWEIAFAA